ncbi:MAG: hypothetical protein PUC23_01145 [bacterium]|nr:hypothetical protein [bacterium]
MILVFFLFLSILTIFLSIKMSYYADVLSKTTKASIEAIGGILLAGITSLPELITCFSSIYLDNIYLAVGDIIGSNLFNITIICFFDIIFVKKMMFNKTTSKALVYIILLINYFFIYLSLNGNISLSLFNIGFPTFIVLFTYTFYIKKQLKTQNESSNDIVKKEKFIVLKFILTAIFLVLISTLLTIIVNKISIMYPSFSSSFIGAIFLGITTSLPEVITFISLIKLENYDMALSDIIGSNLFNLLVLSIGDIIFRHNQIYYYADFSSVLMLKLCIITTFISFVQNKRNKSFCKITYIIPSIIVVLLYFMFWLLNI